jgi:hypothetical protein
LVANINEVIDKKKEEMPYSYQIIFDESNGMFRTIARDSTDHAYKTVDDGVNVMSVKGNGCSFFSGFR